MARTRSDNREVQLGALHENLRVVTSGLASGERIVVNGIQRARPNESGRVRTVDMLNAARESQPESQPDKQSDSINPAA